MEERERDLPIYWLQMLVKSVLADTGVCGLICHRDVAVRWSAGLSWDLNYNVTWLLVDLFGLK